MDHSVGIAMQSAGSVTAPSGDIGTAARLGSDHHGYDTMNGGHMTDHSGGDPSRPNMPMMTVPMMPMAMAGLSLGGYPRPHHSGHHGHAFPDPSMGLNPNHGGLSNGGGGGGGGSVEGMHGHGGVTHATHAQMMDMSNVPMHVGNAAMVPPGMHPHAHAQGGGYPHIPVDVANMQPMQYIVPPAMSQQQQQQQQQQQHLSNGDGMSMGMVDPVGGGPVGGMVGMGDVGLVYSPTRVGVGASTNGSGGGGPNVLGGGGGGVGGVGMGGPAGRGGGGGGGGGVHAHRWGNRGRGMKPRDGVEHSKTNVYISGLKPSTSDDDLRQLCHEYGTIVSAKAIIDREHNICKGYGFVMYETEDQANRAVDVLVRKGVQAAFAKISKPNETQILQNVDPTNLYLTNLPADHDEDALHAMLASCQAGEVVSCRVLRDENGDSRRVGLARMDSHDACEAIVKRLNGCILPGSVEALRVKYANGPTTRKKRSGARDNGVDGFADYSTGYDIDAIAVAPGLPTPTGSGTVLPPPATIAPGVGGGGGGGPSGNSGPPSAPTSPYAASTWASAATDGGSVVSAVVSPTAPGGGGGGPGPGARSAASGGAQPPPVAALAFAHPVEAANAASAAWSSGGTTLPSLGPAAPFADDIGPTSVVGVTGGGGSGNGNTSGTGGGGGVGVVVAPGAGGSVSPVRAPGGNGAGGAGNGGATGGGGGGGGGNGGPRHPHRQPHGGGRGRQPKQHVDNQPISAAEAAARRAQEASIRARNVNYQPKGFTAQMSGYEKYMMKGGNLRDDI